VQTDLNSLLSAPKSFPNLLSRSCEKFFNLLNKLLPRMQLLLVMKDAFERLAKP